MKVTQSCLTVCDSMDCSLPGSSVHDILQARILEWVAIPFSRGSSQPRNQPGGLLHCRQILYQLSYQWSPVWKWSHSVMSDSLWPHSHKAYQAPLSMGFSRQEYWSGLPFPFPGDLPDPGIEPSSPILQADALPSEPPGKPRLLSP